MHLADGGRVGGPGSCTCVWHHVMVTAGQAARAVRIVARLHWQLSIHGTVPTQRKWHASPLLTRTLLLLLLLLLRALVALLLLLFLGSLLLGAQQLVLVLKLRAGKGKSGSGWGQGAQAGQQDAPRAQANMSRAQCNGRCACHPHNQRKVVVAGCQEFAGAPSPLQPSPHLVGDVLGAGGVALAQARALGRLALTTLLRLACARDSSVSSAG